MKFTKMQGCGNDYLYINEEKRESVGKEVCPCAKNL